MLVEDVLVAETGDEVLVVIIPRYLP